MTYIHFSAHPLGDIHSVEQIDGMAARGDKPNGLWFSVEGNDDGWKSWCEGENWRLSSLACQTEIVFASDAHVLQLNNLRLFDQFSRHYRVIPDWAKGLSRPHFIIDWLRVAEIYDAIIIAPYYYERRLHDDTTWYYSWDCASGCVWNAKAVAALNPIEMVSA